MMKLMPCVLLGDFGTTKLADVITTAQARRWSTTDAVNWIPSHSRAQMLWDRRSLRIAAGAGTAADSIDYGVAGTDVGTNDITNAFGSVVDDLTWATHLGCWLYGTEDKYAAGDPDQFKLYVKNGGAALEVYWPSTFSATDKWLWVQDTPDVGTFAANADNIEQWGFKSTAAFTASSYFYVNTFCAFRNTLSATAHDYTFSNAIELATSSYIPTDQNVWRVTGSIIGDRPLDLARQLHEMSTLDLQVLHPVRRVSPKYQSMHDCELLKVYLMYQEETLGHRLMIANSGKTVTAAVPVIISNVSTEWVAPSKEIISFSFDAYRFAGV